MANTEAKIHIAILKNGGIVIKNVNFLTDSILPKYFNHQNYLSFVRQLNLYGFNKIRSSDRVRHVFRNKLFLAN